MSTPTLEQKAVELITSLQNMAAPAMKVAVQAIHVSAVIDVITAAILGAVAVTMFLCIPALYRVLAEKLDDDFSHPGVGMPPVFLGIIALVFGCVSLSTLLSTSTWLAMFAPELALAMSILRRVGGAE